MAINLENYETVEQRIMRFKEKNPNYRMHSELVDMQGAPGNTRWVVKVTLWLDAADEHPVSTGFAFEVDGAGMANKTAALENCETSAFGRALANAGYSGNKRVTREEMLKVRVGEYRELIAGARDEESLRKVFEQGKAEGLGNHINPLVSARLSELRGESGAQ